MYHHLELAGAIVSIECPSGSNCVTVDLLIAAGDERDSLDAILLLVGTCYDVVHQFQHRAEVLLHLFEFKSCVHEY